MKILCFDTCSFYYSVAIVEDFVVVSSIVSKDKQMQCEELILQTEDLLANNNLNYNDIDAVAVIIGPGTFNGTRIGMAAAYGISIAKKIPIYGVNSLQMIACKALLMGYSFPLKICFLADNTTGFIQDFFLDDSCIKSYKDEPDKINLQQANLDNYIKFDVNHFDLIDSQISNAAATGIFIKNSKTTNNTSLFYGKPPSINGQT
jgi:tRNA threonylcarbamoyl adenosine modification protein YeaZ